MSPHRRRQVIEVLTLYAICLAIALALAAMLVAFTGGSARAVFSALLDGSVRRPGRWGKSIGEAIPLLLVALGTIISSKAGLVNIGQEGQLAIGAATATYVGVRLGGPGPLVIIALCAAGALGGAIWAGIAGVLRFRRGVPEVLTTLLLVSIASNVVGYGLKKRWLLLAPQAGRGNRNLESEQLAPNVRLPRGSLFGNEIPIGAFIGVALAIAIGLGLAWSVWGFRLRVLGRNPRAAQRSGVSQTKYGMAAMLISGGFAGLAGAFVLAGGDFAKYQLVPGLSNNLGWTGLLVALVARERASAAIAVAFVFAALRTGSGFLSSTGVPNRITDVVQAFIVLALLLPPAILYIRQRRRALAATDVRV